MCYVSKNVNNVPPCGLIRTIYVPLDENGPKLLFSPD